MKWTGLGAVASAALLTVACGGDARDGRGDDTDRAVGTSGVSTDDSAALHRDDDAGAADGARIGPALEDDQTRSSGRAETMHGATADARHFAERAAYAGNAEVKLGQLAAERAQSPAVKEFAQMMVRDHSKSGSELRQAVSRHDVQSPAGLDPEHQRLYDRLARLQGVEFDREYMKAMVDGHQKVRSLLSHRVTSERPGADRTRGATGTSGSPAATTQLDTAVNQWATRTLPAVEQHLQKAEQVRTNVAGNAGVSATMPKGNTGTAGAGKPGHSGDAH